MLAAFLFTGDDVFKEISSLSGGERGRVSLAKLMLSEANFLILDEPTNHLDITSKEILESALNRYTGTVLYEMCIRDRPQAQKTLSRHQKPGAGKSFICPVDLYTSVRQTGRFLLLIPIVIYSLNVIVLI